MFKLASSAKAAVRTVTLVTLLAGVFALHAFAAAQGVSKRQEPGADSTMVWISVKSGSDLAALKKSLAASGAKILTLAPEGRILARIPAGGAAGLSLLPAVSAVEPMALTSAAEGAEEPNEPRGLGDRPPTPEEQEFLDKNVVLVDSVAANRLSRMRAALEAQTLDAGTLDALPALVDNSLSQYFPPIRSQGSQGSCTCWAACYYYNTYLQASDEGWNAKTGGNSYICSPAFMYPLINGGADNGASTAYAVSFLNEVGCCSWAVMPYSSSDWTTWPSEAAWIAAMNNRTKTAKTIGGGGLSDAQFQALKQHLANGKIAATNTGVYSNWYNNYPNNTTGISSGVLFVTTGTYVGGHALTVVGFDDNKSYFDGAGVKHGAFLIANSWGSGWGVVNTTGSGTKGFLWVAYDHFRAGGGFWGVAYYNDDRPDYRPQLYASTGMNQSQRNKVSYLGGVGPATGSLWTSYYPISNDGGSTLSLTDAKRVAVDLTDGIPSIPDIAHVQLYARMAVSSSASSSGTITSAQFFHDFDANGVFSSVVSGDPIVTVTTGSTGYASVAFWADDLVVSTTQQLASTGPFGGPFSPSSINYTLTNTGAAARDWTTSPSCDWLCASPSGGTLAAGVSAVVAVSLTAAAGSAPVGANSGLMYFTNTATGVRQARAATLTVQDNLSIAPSAAQAFAGPAGGPFTPSSILYTLTNASLCPLDWSTSSGCGWLGASPSNGTLAAGTSVVVTVSIAPAANLLPSGTASGAMWFINSTLGLSQQRSVNLTVRPISAYRWDVVASPQQANAPFPVRLTAIDSMGSAVPAFTGTVNLSAFTTNTFKQIGSGTSTWNYPMGSAYADMRTQVIYRKSDLGPESDFNTLSLYVSTAPGQALSFWTIRMKHTALDAYAGSGWESSGWTTVHQTIQTIASTGWVTFAFSTPFHYDGVNNLMIDFSFNSERGQSADGLCRYSTATGNRVIYARSNNAAGDPLTWSGSSPAFSSAARHLNIILENRQPVPMSPAVAGPFVAGVWSGAASMGAGCPSVAMAAADAQGRAGISNSFAVQNRRSLSVASMNPNNGIDIAVSPADANGQSNGTTQFARVYDWGTTVTLTAALVSPEGALFRHWLKDGAGFAGNGARTLVVIMDADHAMKAVYSTEAPTLTVQSHNPDGGVAVAININDRSGLYGGVTQFVRTYPRTSAPTLTAPPVAPNGYLFVKWLKDGADFANGAQRAAVCPMETDHTMTAVYQHPSSSWFLTVASQGATGGTVISLYPPSANNQTNGTTPFMYSYPCNSLVTLAAPSPAPNGYDFVKWLRDGADFPYNNQRAALCPMNADHAMTALYAHPANRALLTVAATNAGGDGVTVAVYPQAANGRTTGTTQFVYPYAFNSLVTLTAPSMAPGNGWLFRKWRKNGLDFANNTQTAAVCSMTTDSSMSAVYQHPEGQYILCVRSANPASGVSIAVYPADLRAQTSGATPFNCYYTPTNLVTLTAPPFSPAGKPFVKWLKDGANFANNTQRSILCNMNGDHAMTAVYQP